MCWREKRWREKADIAHMTQAGVATVMLLTSRLQFWHIWDTFIQQLSEAINHIMTSFCKFNLCAGINRWCILWKTLELQLAASRRSSAWIESLSFQHIDRSHLQLAFISFVSLVILFFLPSTVLAVGKTISIRYILYILNTCRLC